MYLALLSRLETSRMSKIKVTLSHEHKPFLTKLPFSRCTNCRADASRLPRPSGISACVSWDHQGATNLAANTAQHMVQAEVSSCLLMQCDELLPVA